MKWKITIRFILAVLAVIIVSNLVNLLISNYYQYESYATTQVFSGIFTMGVVSEPDSDRVTRTLTKATNRDRADIEINVGEFKEPLESGYKIDGNTTISWSVVEAIETKGGWIQVISMEGEEIASINKPESIRNFYTQQEMEQAAKSLLTLDEYVLTIEYPHEEGVNVAYVIGMPRPDINFQSMMEYNLDYLRQLDIQNIVTSGVALLTALLLGYLLAVRLNRPVVKITDGITAMAGGNYDVEFPQDSLYKNIYKSLNHMAAALKTSEQERQKNEKIREEWIMNISHDLKTPLSSIKGYSELLHESGEVFSYEDWKKYIQIIMEKSVYMDALIEDLKLTQKLKNDLLPLKKEKANLVEILRETVISILNTPGYESRSIEFDTDVEEIIAEFDWLLFKRAFTNIISNAMIHNVEETIIRITIHHGDRVTITIEDNGNGISESEQKKLFERYYRGTSTSASHAGSGLGLAIAREIIEAHGGEITLNSKMGEGTTIKIFL